MLARLFKIFKRNESKQSTDSGFVFIGGNKPDTNESSNQERLVDANGKAYSHFQLITSGELAGLYRPVILFGSCDLTDARRSQELEDILRSGHNILWVDPKGS